MTAPLVDAQAGLLLSPPTPATPVELPARAAPGDAALFGKSSVSRCGCCMPAGVGSGDADRAIFAAAAGAGGRPGIDLTAAACASCAECAEADEEPAVAAAEPLPVDFSYARLAVFGGATR